MKEIFQPQLQLALEPDGEYTLNVVTICPNSGYSAGRAYPGIPPTVRLTAETFSVILELHVRRGPALQVLTPVRHHLRNLKLGPKHGKTSVMVFTMLRGHIIGTASVAVHASHECPKNPSAIETAQWYAWLSKMPPGPTTFHVSGIAYLPTPGFTTQLVRAAPQGINPKELILDLKVTPLPGFWPPVVTAAPLRFDESAPGIDYEGVLIREPDGDAVHIEVDIAR